MKRQRTESFSPESKGGKPLTPGLNNFPEKVAIVTSSMAPDASPGLKQQGQSDVPPAFWSQNSTRDSPLTPAFSPFTPNLHIPPPQSWPTQHTEPSPREDIAWSVPQRSISYSNLEGLHGQQPQHQYTPSYTQSPSSSVPDNHYTTKPRQHPGMYPPPSTQTTNSMMVPTSATSSPLPILTLRVLYHLRVSPPGSNRIINRSLSGRIAKATVILIMIVFLVQIQSLSIRAKLTILQQRRHRQRLHTTKNRDTTTDHHILTLGMMDTQEDKKPWKYRTNDSLLTYLLTLLIAER
jgi:hypothetical protein